MYDNYPHTIHIKESPTFLQKLAGGCMFAGTLVCIFLLFGLAQVAYDADRAQERVVVLK